MQIIITIFRLLTFRITREEILNFTLQRHFLVGLIGTWIVGMGRYWDDPGAKLLQHIGLGSVIYIFVLAAFIWLIVKPYVVDDWTYPTVLTFISLTSFPAIFYAIPVERFMSIESANTANVWFLAIVALWRLCMLYYFIRTFTRLGHGDTLTATFLPMGLIITALTYLNLQRAVFDVMGGVRNATPHDSAYVVLLLLTLVSIVITPILLIAYGIGIYFRYKKWKQDCLKR
jgi:hypothetical protein